MKLTRHKLKNKFNQASCWLIKKTRPPVNLATDCGLLTIFHDYEGSYAASDMADASLHGVSRILDIEKEHGIQATYNIVGKLMLDVPRIVERIIADGHDIASHSYQHQVLSQLNRRELEEDIAASREVFASYGLELRGIRSPQSRWSFLQTRVMLEQGLEWSAENDSGYRPYAVRKNGTAELIRLPVVLDDWEYESHNLSPESMYRKLVAKVDWLSDRRCYGAIGFHPWVQGKQEARLEVFAAFMEYVAGKPGLKTLTFSQASERSRGKVAVQ